MNPFFDAVRSEIRQEAADLRETVKERDLDDYDFTEEEALSEIDTVESRMNQATWYEQETVETQFDVYESMRNLSRQWESANTPIVEKNDVDDVTSILYTRASGAARREGDKVRWLLERQHD